MPTEFPPFATLTLKVGSSTVISNAPSGRRVLVEFVDATLEGPRLRAKKIDGAPASDWLSVSNNVAVLDIRIVFRTDEGAAIAMQMYGRADATKFLSGGPVTVAATFEADDTRLRWLNLAVVAGTGGVVGTDVVVVELYEVHGAGSR